MQLGWLALMCGDGEDEEGAGAGDVEGEPPFRSRVHWPQPQPRASIARRIKLRSPSLSHNCRTRVHGLLRRSNSGGKGVVHGVENATSTRQKVRLSRRGFEPLPPYGDEKPRLR
jgi:hypothetical protein